MATEWIDNWQLVPEHTTTSESQSGLKAWSLEKRGGRDSDLNNWRYGRLFAALLAYLRSNSRLLRLPPELRLAIYTLVLKGEKRWNIRHSGDCGYRERWPTAEAVPFMEPQSCPCIRSHRRCLGFLLVCRQINHEATPVWYRNNTISVYQGWRVSAPLIELQFMRPLIRDNIRHLSLLAVSSSGVEAFEPATWGLILDCARLQTLELDRTHLNSASAELISQLCGMPCFRVLRAVTLDTVWTTYGTVVARFAKIVPLPLDDEEMRSFKDKYGDEENEWMDAARAQLHEYMEYCVESRKSQVTPYARLRYPDGTARSTRVYGAPNTSKVRERLTRAVRLELCATQAEENERLLRERKDAARASRLDAEAADHATIKTIKREVREQRRGDLVQEERRTEKKAERNEQRRLQTKIQKQEKIRRRERKRG